MGLLNIVVAIILFVLGFASARRAYRYRRILILIVLGISLTIAAGIFFPDGTYLHVRAIILLIEFLLWIIFAFLAASRVSNKDNAHG